ncbi:MAG: hypothetical protein QW128_04670 [Thermoprotei archaeon]
MSENIITIIILFLLIFTQLIYLIIVEINITDSLIDNIQNNSLANIIRSGSSGYYGL